MHEGVADDGIEKTGAENQLLRIGPMELDPIEHVIDFDMVARQFEHFARRVGCHHPKAGCLQAQLDWNSRRTGPEIENVATEGSILLAGEGKQIPNKGTIDFVEVHIVVLDRLLQIVHDFRF